MILAACIDPHVQIEERADYILGAATLYRHVSDNDGCERDRDCVPE